MEDVAPILLQKIQADFQKQYENDNEVKALLGKLKEGTARHTEAYAYAGKVGGILADSYAGNLSGEVLPEGKMWYNIGNRVIAPTLEENYKYISDYVSEVQAQLNQAAGIGIKPIVPPENKDRAKGIIDRLSSEDDFDKVAWILKEPIKTIARSIVDDSIKANAEFHGKSGMIPKIIRKSSGKCCKWCNEVAGVYHYPDVPDDVYRRHENCDCVVEYDPGNGKRQNVHTKQWRNEETIEYRKNVRVKKDIKKWIIKDVEDVTQEYIEHATPEVGNIKFDDGVRAEDRIVSDWLFKKFGGNIHTLKDVNLQNVKTPDAYWNGKFWEYKNPKSENAIDKRLKDAFLQLKGGSGGIVLDITGSVLSKEKAIEVIARRLPIRAKNDVDVIVKHNDSMVIVMRYRKKE